MGFRQSGRQSFAPRAPRAQFSRLARVATLSFLYAAIRLLGRDSRSAAAPARPLERGPAMAPADETKGAVAPGDPLAKAAAALPLPAAETAPPAEVPPPQRGFINYLKQHPK